MFKDSDYCKCKNRSGEHAVLTEWGFWMFCDNCNKPDEDGYQDDNHYDGEDHTFDYE